MALPTIFQPKIKIKAKCEQDYKVTSKNNFIKKYTKVNNNIKLST